jgi:triosephosphate isomerase
MGKLIVANWKLNPLTVLEAQHLAEAISEVSPHRVVLCPPTPFLTVVKYSLLGAQDVFWKAKGPFTGQVSPAMLQNLGVKYAIIGHSERRSLGETSQEVREKAAAALEYNITPIVCVGHGTTVEQDELEVVDVLRQQLDDSLVGLPAEKIVVAYEPVWAIGSGKAATPDHAEKIGIFVQTKYQIKTVLYGGSVNDTNSASFLAQPHVGGLLVGTASLRPDEFNRIIA